MYNLHRESYCMTNGQFINNVCIIEDDESIGTMMKHAIEEEGAKVVSLFYDGDDAWEAIRETCYDLIILDWKVPGLNGLVLFNRVRQDERHRGVPILVISGFLSKKDFTLLSEFPLSGKLEKPFQMSLFLRVVKNLVKEARWYKEQTHKLDEIFTNLARGVSTEKLWS